MKKIFNVLVFMLIMILGYQLYLCNLKLNTALNKPVDNISNKVVASSSPKIIYKDKIIYRDKIIYQDTEKTKKENSDLEMQNELLIYKVENGLNMENKKIGK